MARLKPTTETIRDLHISTSHREDRNEFEHCELLNCTFSDLSQLSFTDCIFRNCNLSNAKTRDTALRNCHFSHCKLLGTGFSGSRDFTFEVHFEDCVLDYASFDKKKLYQSSFRNCRLHHANFTDADLSKAQVAGCDFYEALFSGTNLSGVDLSSSVNLIIDPELNNIKKAKFALQSLPGLLLRHQIEII